MTQKGYDVDYSHPAQAAYVVALLKQLGVTQAIFVGHSMGGNVLAFIAATYPEMVQKMIFVDPALFTTKQSGGSLVRFPPFRRLFQQIMLRYITEARLKSLLQSAYDKKSVVSDETVKAYAAPTQIKDWELSFLGMVRDSGKNTLDISRINKQLPVLILWGENDTWVPIKQATVLTDYFTNETFIKIPDIGHVVQEEKPEEFVKVLIPFVDR
jgi:pimeloyl-ACP methyl ester carboxylesterase